MPAGVWKALAGFIAVLAVAVVALDQWQARQGLTSLFWSSGRPAAEARPARAISALPPAPAAASGAPRLAIIVDDLGMTGIDSHLHALRHYSATELLTAGVDLRTVAGRLGHGGGGATTLRVYAAWVGEADRRASEILGSRMKRPGRASGPPP